ncbi:diphthine--ammonia ligase [Thiomicrorhabdus indica]|uniref:Dph6-related ATP pyrophosphatase n=1 Tax=Thiomicrorhabdus indica TaxID=2267253 RepID=UPI002AA8C055|nr:diphthine--ammonia ligase [Thiomicrorhabdus indica]
MLKISHQTNLQNTNHQFASSWSGGKDACMALYLLMQAGHTPKVLYTMLYEDSKTSRAHNLPVAVLRAQAEALGIPNYFQSCAKAIYKTNYQAVLKSLKDKNIDSICLGDIDLQAHRDWQEDVTRESSITPLFPLWLLDHKKLVEELIRVGFEATIMAVHPEKAPESLLGKPLNTDTIAELEELNIDVCAEGGEFHTVITNGPIFNHPVKLSKPTLRRGAEFGYSFLDYSTP